MCLSTGTPKKNNFSFEINGKLMALGVPILKHFRVCCPSLDQLCQGSNKRPKCITEDPRYIDTVSYRKNSKYWDMYV